jgi:hypothetical protein
MENNKSPFEDYNVVMDEETLALIRIAQNPELAPINPGENISPMEQDVYKYIRAKGIVKGARKIPIYLIFDDYKKWTSLKGFKQKGFTTQFNKVFKAKRTGSVKFYELDPTPFNLPDNYSIWTDPVVVESK